MDLKSIINKVVEGTKLLLVQPTMYFRDLSDRSLKTKHMVLEDEAGRPDLIADRVYGDHRMVDIILKYNNTSDPFSIAAGEILRIPEDNIAYYRLERPEFSETTNIVKAQFLDTKRLKDPKQEARVKALKTKYGKDELLPPNVIPTGRKTYKFDNGMVKMGKNPQTAPVTNSTTLKNLKDLDGAGADAIINALDAGDMSVADAAKTLADLQKSETDSNTADTGTNTQADTTGGNNTDSGNPGGGNNGGTDDTEGPCAK